jgi:signal transduction histidine kinase
LLTLRATFARFIMTWSLVVNAIWWVTDRAVMGGIPGAVEAFDQLRIAVVGCALVALLILRGVTTLVGPRLLACIAIWLFELGFLAYSLAAIGDLASPWFHFTYPLVLTSIVLPFGLPARSMFASLMGVSLLTGFILGRPPSLHSEFLGSSIGYMVFTVGVAIAWGHRIQLLTRRSFEQQLELEANAAVIAGQREALQDEVDRRTAELRLLAEYLDRASEEERRRIARELHDELGQSVSALRISMATARRRYARDPNAIGANLDDLDELVRRVAMGTKDAITHLRPRILDDRGLAAAVTWLAESTERHHELPVTLELAGDLHRFEPQDVPETRPDSEVAPREADATSTVAFRVLQESLNNVVRHARATRVDVSLRVNDAELLVSVQDDGVGLDGHAESPSSRGTGMGMLSMRERVRAIGGRLQVTSSPGKGTRVECRLPIAGLREAA